MRAKTYKLTDGTWTITDGSNDMMAVRGLQTKFYAYYPVKEGNSYDSGTVEENQNDADITLSDYMTATTSVDPAKDRTINLSFQRKTAKVTVNIVRFLDEVAEDDRNISSVQIGANMNVGDKAGKNIGSITMKNVEGTEKPQFVALVGPTAPSDLQGQSDVYFLALNFTSRARLYTTSVPTSLEAGKSYTFNLTVGGDKLTIENVTVADYTNDVESSEGKLVEGLRLSTNEELQDWLNTHIGDKKGQTLTLSGTVHGMMIILTSSSNLLHLTVMQT